MMKTYISPRIKAVEMGNTTLMADSRHFNIQGNGIDLSGSIETVNSSDLDKNSFSKGSSFDDTDE